MRGSETDPDDAAAGDDGTAGDDTATGEPSNSRRELAAGTLTVVLGAGLAALGTSLIDPTSLVAATPVVVATIVAGSLVLPGAVVAWRTGTVTPVSVAASGVLVAIGVLAYGVQSAGLTVPLSWSTLDSVAAVSLAAVPFLLGPQFVDAEIVWHP